MISSAPGQVPFAGLMWTEKSFPGVPGVPAGPAGPAGPADPVVPVSPLSPLSPLGPSKQPASVNDATHPTNAIATRIICPPPTQSSRPESLFNQLIGALLKRHWYV